MGVAQIPKGYHVPIAAFFDLPRPVKNPQPCPCGGERSPFSSSSCQRCFKRRARERFASRWAARFPDYPAAAALADIIAPQRNSDFLDEAIARALEAGAEPEAFRAALEEEGQRAFVQSRDERAASHKRGGRKSTGLPRQTKRDLQRDVPLTVDSMERVRELLRSKNSYWWKTGTHWSEQDHMDALLMCKARVKLEKASNALGRSPETVAWRCSDAGMRLPDEWRAYLPERPGASDPFSTGIRVVRQYPYAPRRDERSAIVYAVNALVPRAIPGREDVCQDILLAILAGETTLEHLKTNRSDVRRFVARFRSENYEAGGYAASLDEPIASADGDSKATLGSFLRGRRSFEHWEKL